MIFYRFVSEYWTDGYSFRKAQDIIMEAKDIESFFDEYIDRYPYLTFQVTTLKSEDEYGNIEIRPGDRILGTVPRTVHKNSETDYGDDRPRRDC